MKSTKHFHHTSGRRRNKKTGAAKSGIPNLNDHEAIERYANPTGTSLYNVARVVVQTPNSFHVYMEFYARMYIKVCTLHFSHNFVQ